MTPIRFRIGPDCPAILVRPFLRYESTSGIVLPQGDSYALTGDDTYSFEPSTTEWAYESHELGAEGITRYWSLPDQVGTIDYEDLTDVLPSTFDPSVENLAGWNATLTAVQAQATVATGAASAAAASAVTATAATATKVDKGELVFNVKNAPYNAAGDGTTNDTAAIQSAMTAAAATGVKLYFPPGTYLISGRSGYYNAILKYVSNTYLFGDAQGGAVIKVANGQTVAGDYQIFAPATQNLSTVNVTFENLTIDGNAANNLVLGSPPLATARAARAIMLPVGSNIRVQGCEFRNMPGRNVLYIGNGSSTPITNVWILNNKFHSVGGAITGNEAQNDHTCIYCQGFGAEIAGNKFWNDAPVSMLTPSYKVVCGIEAHGSNTIVHDNFVQNFTTGGRSVAIALDAKHITYRDNIFLDMTELGLDIWCTGGFVNQGTTFVGNTIRLYGVDGTELAGIYQPFSTGGTTSEVQDFEIKDNLIYSDFVSSVVAATPGVWLNAVRRGAVSGNTIRNMQGPGVYLGVTTQAGLVIEDVTIDDNLIMDCARNTATGRPFAIQGAIDAGYTHSRITVRRNRMGQSSTTGVMRGIRFQGPGTLNNATIDGDNVFHKIADPSTLITTTSATNFNRFNVQPRVTSGPTSTNPVSGVWVAGQDLILHTDPTSTDATGKIVTGSGGATSATWAATTAYTAAQWIRTSAGKVLECTVSGTSSGSQPTPTTLGSVFTDGTVTWAYRATGAATFSPYGGPLVSPGGAVVSPVLSTLGDTIGAVANANGSTAPAGANGGIAMRVRPARNVTVAKLVWVVATVGDGSTQHYDIGVYDNAGAKLWTKGSTLWPTSLGQVVETVSPTVALTAGSDYWVVVSTDSTVPRFFCATNVSTYVKEMTAGMDGTYSVRGIASVFPLPTSTITLGSTGYDRAVAVAIREA